MCNFHIDHTSGGPNPRKIPMGEFAFNEARGNGDSGMRFHNSIQSGTSSNNSRFCSLQN